MFSSNGYKHIMELFNIYDTRVFSYNSHKTDYSCRFTTQTATINRLNLRIAHHMAQNHGTYLVGIVSRHVATALKAEGCGPAVLRLRSAAHDTR